MDAREHAHPWRLNNRLGGDSRLTMLDMIRMIDRLFTPIRETALGWQTFCEQAPPDRCLTAWQEQWPKSQASNLYLWAYTAATDIILYRRTDFPSGRILIRFRRLR